MAAISRSLYRNSRRYRQTVVTIYEYAQALYRTDPDATPKEVHRDMARHNQATGFTFDLAGPQDSTLRIEGYRLTDDALQGAVDMAQSGWRPGKPRSSQEEAMGLSVVSHLTMAVLMGIPRTSSSSRRSRPGPGRWNR